MADPAPRTVDQHHAEVLAAVEPQAPSPQPRMDARGLAAAEDVVATLQLPGFDNSAMDG
ncbi:molybdopterin molybdenumtransferase MoeA, partial [Nocardioides sp. SOB72]|nr:molybdopterin molybdenumtransferase MoeA [Nocardioides abyssi]